MDDWEISIAKYRFNDVFGSLVGQINLIESIRPNKGLANLLSDLYQQNAFLKSKRLLLSHFIKPMWNYYNTYFPACNLSAPHNPPF